MPSAAGTLDGFFSNARRAVNLGRAQSGGSPSDWWRCRACAIPRRATKSGPYSCGSVSVGLQYDRSLCLGNKEMQRRTRWVGEVGWLALCMRKGNTGTLY